MIEEVVDEISGIRRIQITLTQKSMPHQLTLPGTSLTALTGSAQSAVGTGRCGLCGHTQVPLCKANPIPKAA